MIDADVLKVARDLEAAKLAENAACLEAYATLRTCEVAEVARIAARKRWTEAKQETVRLQSELLGATLATAELLGSSVGEHNMPNGYYPRLEAIRKNKFGSGE